ncbi:hypothetical protein DRO56_05245 [Candidatus Bathyarchaeota archaeon]|nr:MAG: hypothetical protein DRO56_05245 [Candidatus Bathyarchaeota archaeon]
MGFQIRVLQKGKVTIPVEIRRRLGLREGDVLTLELRGGMMVLIPARTVENPTDLICGLAEGATIQEPVDGELRRASAGRIERKISRAERSASTR